LQTAPVASTVRHARVHEAGIQAIIHHAGVYIAGIQKVGEGNGK